MRFANSARRSLAARWFLAMTGGAVLGVVGLGCVGAARAEAAPGEKDVDDSAPTAAAEPGKRLDAITRRRLLVALDDYRAWVQRKPGDEKDKPRGEAALVVLRAAAGPGVAELYADKLWREKSNSVKAVLLECLAKFDEPEALEAIVKTSVLDDSDWVRGQAAGQLRRHPRARQAVPLFIRLLGVDCVSPRAAQALSQSGLADPPEQGQPLDQRLALALVNALWTKETTYTEVRAFKYFIGPVSFGPIAGVGFGVSSRGYAEQWAVVKGERTVANPTVLTVLTHYTGNDHGFDQKSWRLVIANDAPATQTNGTLYPQIYQGK